MVSFSSLRPDRIVLGRSLVRVDNSNARRGIGGGVESNCVHSRAGLTRVGKAQSCSFTQLLQGLRYVVERRRVAQK